MPGAVVGWCRTAVLYPVGLSTHACRSSWPFWLVLWLVFRLVLCYCSLYHFGCDWCGRWQPGELRNKWAQRARLPCVWHHEDWTSQFLANVLGGHGDPERTVARQAPGPTQHGSDEVALVKPQRWGWHYLKPNSSVDRPAGAK